MQRGATPPSALSACVPLALQMRLALTALRTATQQLRMASTTLPRAAATGAATARSTVSRLPTLQLSRALAPASGLGYGALRTGLLAQRLQRALSVSARAQMGEPQAAAAAATDEAAQEEPQVSLRDGCRCIMHLYSAGLVAGCVKFSNDHKAAQQSVQLMCLLQPRCACCEH